MTSSKEQKYETAIKMIRHILDDDKNYQHASLKIGGIWQQCIHVANFRTGKTIDGQGFVEILDKDNSEVDIEKVSDEISDLMDESFDTLNEAFIKANELFSRVFGDVSLFNLRKKP